MCHYLKDHDQQAVSYRGPSPSPSARAHYIMQPVSELLRHMSPWNLDYCYIDVKVDRFHCTLPSKSPQPIWNRRVFRIQALFVLRSCQASWIIDVPRSSFLGSLNSIQLIEFIAFERITMSKLAVFPASGKLGTGIFAHMKLMNPSKLIIISRDPSNIPADHINAGVTTRQPEYDSPETLSGVQFEHRFEVSLSHPNHGCH